MAHLESLVVLDPNQRSRDALAFGFARDGYEVFAVEEGAEALQAVRKNGVQLVVVATPDASGAGTDGDGADVKSPVADPLLAVVGRLRQETATRELPIVVLGDRLGREEALRSGADEFVARPAFLRDVITLSKLAVALRQGGDPAGIAAQLDDYGLYFLTRALAVAGRSAVITLGRGERRGELAFAQGEIVSARVGGLRGLAAYQHLLIWSHATLELQLESPAGERKLTLPVEELLGQGARFVERFEEHAAPLGGPDAVFAAVTRRVAAVRAEMPPSVFTLLKLCDGARAVIDLVEDGPFKPFDAVGVLTRLQELGAIERLDGDEERPTPPRTPLREQLAVRDWLVGAGAEEARTTVTEAGRRAAEAYAEEAALRSTQSAPADDLFESPAIPRPVAPAAKNSQSAGKSKKKKKGKHARDASRHSATAPAPASTSTPTVQASAPVNGQSNGHGLTPTSGSAPPVATAAAPAAKLTPAQIAEAPVKEKLFDDMDEAFFAREAEPSEPVDTFDDLPAPQKPKRSWSLFDLVRSPDKKR